MPYTPTEWKTGDIVSSERMNKIENELANSSGGGGVFIVTSDSEYRLDKTYQEIYNALIGGKNVLIADNTFYQSPGYSYYTVGDFGFNGDNFYYVQTQNKRYTCQTPSDYPIFDA